jgi:hypothetical protein
MNWDDFLGGLFGGTAGNVIAGIGGAAAQQKIIKDVEEAGKQDFSTIFGQNYQPPAGGLIGQAQRATEFKPFTVTTPTGSRATLVQVAWIQCSVLQSSYCNLDC